MSQLKKAAYSSLFPKISTNSVQRDLDDIARLSLDKIQLQNILKPAHHSNTSLNLKHFEFDEADNKTNYKPN